MKKVFLIPCIFLLMLGCATTSLTRKPFPQELVQDIVIGKTTQRDVYEKFGKPIYHGDRNQNESWWMYIHTTEDNSESLSVYFDKDGFVSDYLYSPFRKSLDERLANR